MFSQYNCQMKKSIAVIGQGFVGGSLTTVFAERGFIVHTYDKAGKFTPGATPWTGYEASITSLANQLNYVGDFSGVYFVCVPTPMYEDGQCDTSIVESILRELSEVAGNRIAVIKSTVPPGSTERWNTMFEKTGLRVVFNPEFLRESSALDDMRNQSRIVLGGPRPHINIVKNLFQDAFPNVPIIKTGSTTAEMVKYFTNVQLAARVVLSCEISQVCEALNKSGFNIDYDKVVEYASMDQRLGGSHMNVPGSDGIPGARGHCFPKDLNALISVARNHGVTPLVMDAIWQKNLEVVQPEHRDWEKMLGRAVSKKVPA